MKILSVSDFTVPELTNGFDRENFKDIDLIIACGDLQPEYIKDLALKLDKPLYFVRGNHDIRPDYDHLYQCTNIDGSVVNFNGLRILGLEGSIWYNGGKYQYTENEMRLKIFRSWFTIWRNKGIDMVVTHAPPRHVNDGEDRCHMGFESFHWLINHYRPRYFIHGHIHKHFSDPALRVSVVQETQVINTCGHHILEFDHEHL